jgi:hypothetical protein
MNNADQPIWHKENKPTNNRSYRPVGVIEEVTMGLILV